MPGREYQAQPSRFGFNGKENDNDVKGFGNQLEYGMRIFDARIGRFLSNDPLSKEYNDLSPYHFAGNNPIQNIDLDGGEPLDYTWNWEFRRFSVNGGEPIYSRNILDPQLGTCDVEAVYDKWTKQTWFIHQKNDGRNYYWKHNPGEDQSIRIAGNGKWVEFKTQNRIQYEHTVKLTRGIATFFAATSSLPFVWAGIAEVGGSAAWVTVKASTMNAIARAMATYWRIVPKAASAGKLVAEFLDESGAVGMQNAASKNIALGLGKNLSSFANSFENTFAVDMWQKVGITSGNAKDFTEEFFEAMNSVIQSGSKVKFDLTNLDLKKALQAAGKSLYDEEAKIGYTEWEFNQILSNEIFKGSTEFFRNGEKVDIDKLIKEIK